MGKAKLHYRRVIPADGVNIDVTLEARGAITSQQQEETLQPDAVKMVHDDLDILSQEIPNSIGLPQYGRPWLPNPADFADGWPATLRDNPRFRGIAGLGLWMGVEAQDDLMDAAVKQAGALREAGQRINHLALGLLASGRLWDHHMPGEKNQRLRILGPMMARMLAASGGFVLDKVTSGTSPLVPALFSSAAQRILRDRSAHTRYTSGANGGFNHNDALDEANQPPREPDQAPAGLPHFDVIANDPDFHLPPLEKLFVLDSKWIESAVEQLAAVARQVGELYREERDRLIEAGKENQIPAMRLDLTQNKLVPALISQLAEFSHHNFPCGEVPMFISHLGDAFPSGWIAYYEQVLEGDGEVRRFAADLRMALRKCIIGGNCSARVANADVPDPDGFCNDLLGGSAAAAAPPNPKTDQPGRAFRPDLQRARPAQVRCPRAGAPVQPADRHRLLAADPARIWHRAQLPHLGPAQEVR